LSWLVVRRCGVLWAIPADRIRAVESAGAETRVSLPDADLVADEVLRLVGDLPFVPAGPVVQSLWRQPLEGLALCDGHPTVLVESRALPECLLGEEATSPAAAGLEGRGAGGTAEKENR
jgi:hypothetical protein